jgi:Holliday junction DNA helicase RuvA
MTTGGVAYEIEVPLSVYERLPKEGDEVELRTVQVVREDSLTLYGFLDAPERNVFGRLLTATGVGPKLALSMLSTMPPGRLVRAILDRDVAALRQIPGLGTKKAEKLVVDMNDRLGDLDLAPSAGPGAGRASEEAVAALVTLGYTHAEASTAVREALDEAAGATGVELIKAALSRLGRS